MRIVLSAEEMMQCDRIAMKSYGISGLILMENAGAGIARWIGQRFGPLHGKTVCVVCGKGNNGGDGFVAARHLTNAGAMVHVFLWSRSQRGDAAKNLEILRRLGLAARASIRIGTFSSSRVAALHPDLVVDALFGTGFSGPVKPAYRKAIQWMNTQPVPRISVDIPSGVNGSTGIADEYSVNATVTLTLGTLKRGLLCNHGRDKCGEIHVVDIGIPTVVFQRLKPGTFLTEREDIKKLLPKRASNVHKYTAGKVFVLAGSTGFTGAAALAARGALRAGAGAVVLGTPSSVYQILARTLTEVIVEPLPSTTVGTLSVDGEDAILNRMEWADVIVIGPGLSRQRETASLVRSLLKKARGNILLDADGLNILAEEKSESVRKSKANFVFTPHAGEASRLFGVSADHIETNRIDAARAGAKSLNETIVLKGAPTAIAAPDGTVFLNSTGNPGMATVGAGDVLAGIIAALWSQGMDREGACRTGVYLHGLAGDLAAERLGQKSLVAGDLIDFLPNAIQRVEGGV
jgi:hydroxyethylthiazole kinase-like uncharacterized protein yjeF